MSKKNPTACFIELKRWFSEKLEKFTKEKGSDSPWVNVLKESPVFAREVDENDSSHATIAWYRIVGFEDHGPDVTLRIVKCVKED